MQDWRNDFILWDILEKISPNVINKMFYRTWNIAEDMVWVKSLQVCCMKENQLRILGKPVLCCVSLWPSAVPIDSFSQAFEKILTGTWSGAPYVAS